MIKNLVYTHKFITDNQVFVYFDPFGVSVKDLDSNALLQRRDSVGDLYLCTPSFVPSVNDRSLTMVSFPTWHRRLGHPGSSILKFLQSRDFISSCTNKIPLFHACQFGKHCRLTFSPFMSKTTLVFELIHSDLRTSPVTSLSGFKYYILFFYDLCQFFVGFSSSL